MLGRIEIFNSAGLAVPVEDEDNDEGESWFVELVKHLVFDVILVNPLLFPIFDDAKSWRNLEEGSKVLKLAAGSHIPPPCSNWTGVDVTSDEAIVQMVFAGICGGRLRRSANPDLDGAFWSVNFDELVNFETRPGFERFGAIAFFSKQQKLIRIHWSMKGIDVYPNSTYWNHAKWVFRSSALVGITVVEHLLSSHFIFSNIVSTTTRESLAKDHPIRRFLKPFNHMAPTVNMGAVRFLTSEYGLLHRTVGLTYNGLISAFSFALQKIRYQGNPMLAFSRDIELLGDNFPYARDGRDYFSIVLNFVSSYVSVYYKTDEDVRQDRYLESLLSDMRVFGSTSKLPRWENLTIPLLSEMFASYIFSVTALHLIVGNVAEYLVHPNFVTAKLRPNTEVCDIASSHYSLVIAILTGSKAPYLMNNFEHLLLVDGHFNKTTQIMRDFQTNLTDFAAEIDRRNANRRFQFNGFDPRRMLSSVSI